MSELDRYLQQHFLTAEAFAASCGICVTELENLIRDRCIPAPSYVVTPAGTVRSSPFGEMTAPGATPGAYFPRANHVWVARALVERDPASLKRRFVDNFTLALAQLDRSTWRLPDCFSETGKPIASGLAARGEQAWHHFLEGTFGLCVADPSCEDSIAAKEILQEKLTALTRNGVDVPDDHCAREELQQLIDRYAAAAMPFSPIEYPRSSRKRLVEDLRGRLADCCG